MMLKLFQQIRGILIFSDEAGRFNQLFECFFPVHKEILCTDISNYSIFVLKYRKIIMCAFSKSFLNRLQTHCLIYPNYLFKRSHDLTDCLVIKVENIYI